MKCYEGALQSGRFPDDFENASKLFNFLIKTVDKLHKSGIIHRDLKPENILISENDFVITDFGIASFNPEIFVFRAITKAGERVGNRLFSAPEQELKNMEPKPTMDIYAIGQIMQWYITGSTHRGTARKRLTEVDKRFEIIDLVVNRCLAFDPEKRFQSIHELVSFVKKNKRKDIFEYIYGFNEVLVRNFPRVNDGIAFSEDPKKINNIFNTLKEALSSFDKHLWWHDGLGNMHIHKITGQGKGVWKINQDEYHFISVYIYYDVSMYNDFMLVQYVKSEPFTFEGEEIYHLAKVDGEHYITLGEYDNGYAEVNGEVINLEDHEVEVIIRQREGGWFFIASEYHCVLETRNDKRVRSYIDSLKNSDNFELNDLKELKDYMRRHKHQEVRMRI
ncbi:MAG: protein kinase [Bacteroidetes bacterium]|nr:protein kinase [Bacteroidota bacterium]